MAETMGAVPTHDDVAFVAREAAEASKSCKSAVVLLPSGRNEAEAGRSGRWYGGGAPRYEAEPP